MRFKEYLKESPSFTTLAYRTKVKNICGALGLNESEYQILPDGSVNTFKATVHFHKSLCRGGKLPIKFNEVDGDFFVESCDLTTLDGCPAKVVGWFSCEDNPRLKSLEGGPKLVQEKYFAGLTGITTLKGIANFFGDFERRVLNLQGCYNLKSVECFKDIPCALSRLAFNDSQFKSLIGINEALPHGFIAEGLLELNFNEVKEGGSMLLLIKGLKELVNAHGLPEPFSIINNYIGTDDGLRAQLELIDKGFDDYAL